MYYYSPYTLCVSIPVILISLINWRTVHSMVFNTKLVDCGSCYCPPEEVPVCVNEDSNKKAFKTYKSPCEWHCGALCYESQLRFMYCGECDDRELPPYGDKGNVTWFECLKFNPIEGAETLEDGSTTEPGDSTPTPPEGAAKPGDSTSEPGDGTPPPGEVTPAPGSGTEEPKDGTAPPGEATPEPPIVEPPPPGEATPEPPIVEPPPPEETTPAPEKRR